MVSVLHSQSLRRIQKHIFARQRKRKFWSQPSALPRFTVFKQAETLSDTRTRVFAARWHTLLHYRNSAPYEMPSGVHTAREATRRRYPAKTVARRGIGCIKCDCHCGTNLA
jgi:hypothetical protein